MFVSRRIVSHLEELVAFFPAISLTGPRQAGKTTLLRQMYPDYKYVSLEKADIRRAAQADPNGFLEAYNDKVIFDEAQRFPELFSYLQGLIDEDRRPGRFILSGSQNFLLRKNISQSLAGRVGIARLLPFDNQELSQSANLPATYQQAILQGGYPGLVDSDFKARLFYDSYLSTYVERDVLELISSNNIDLFQNFLRIIATYSGQEINLQKISNGVGVSTPTIRSWIGILEQSYIIFRLRPYFGNLGKRLTKTPKLYFYDTGLLCYLLGVRSETEVDNYSGAGALFENLIIADAFKSFHHQGEEPRFYFYRDRQKSEVDLVYDRAVMTKLWEIKASRSYHERMITTLERVAARWKNPTETFLVYDGEAENLARKTQKVNWRNLRWKV